MASLPTEMVDGRPCLNFLFFFFLPTSGETNGVSAFLLFRLDRRAIAGGGDLRDGSGAGAGAGAGVRSDVVRDPSVLL